MNDDNPCRLIYRRIGTDMAVAARKGEGGKMRALVDLTIALEKAYPQEMAALRSSELPVAEGTHD